MVSPQAKRQAVDHIKSTHQISERRACGLIVLSRSSYRYKSHPKDDERVIKRLKELAAKYPSYGYLLLHALLKQEGLVTNKKRTYRLYVAFGLQVRTKKRKKLDRPRQPIPVPTSVNQRWSMDFVADQLSGDQRFRILNIVDDFSRECIGQYVDSSISGEKVSDFLDKIISERKKPEIIICDNGKEFTSKALFFWSTDKKVKLGFIQPGKPTQNAFVESFNGKFRAACLNQHWFRTLAEAKTEIDKWRNHYNTVRPHSSLNYLPPSHYAKIAA